MHRTRHSMFTGIIEDIGTVGAIDRRGQAMTMTIESDVVVDPPLGASVAISGPCLTVIETDPAGNTFTVEVTPETFRRTTLGSLEARDPVNLESALTLNDELGGHLVTGHVDGTGVVTGIHQEGNATIWEIRPPADLRPYLAPKGSVAVDGVSLTVVDSEQTFSVSVTGYTEEETTLRDTGVGDEVNLEIDVIARYVEQLTSGESTESGDIMDKLQSMEGR